jgi:hypothetical protein
MTQIASGLDWEKVSSDKSIWNNGKKCVFDGCDIERLNDSRFCYLHGDENHSKTARIQQVYFMLAEDISEFKIGTSIDVGRRFEQIQSEIECRLSLISMIAGGYGLEAHLHRSVSEYRTHGEWFKCEGRAQELLNIAAKKGRRGIEAFLVLYGDL